MFVCLFAIILSLFAWCFGGKSCDISGNNNASFCIGLGQNKLHSWIINKPCRVYNTLWDQASPLQVGMIFLIHTHLSFDIPILPANFFFLGKIYDWHTNFTPTTPRKAGFRHIFKELLTPQLRNVFKISARLNSIDRYLQKMQSDFKKEIINNK